jgi:hypothetical protein
MPSPCCSAQDGKDGEDSEGVVLDVLSPSYGCFSTDVPNGAVQPVVNRNDPFD